MTHPTFVEIHILSGARRGQIQRYIDPQPLPLPSLLTFGRGAQVPQGELVSFDGENKVSRRHLSLSYRGDHLVLRDEGSTHGTFLLPTEHGQPMRRLSSELILHHGTSLRVRLAEDGPICRISVGQAVPFSHYMLVGRLGIGGMGEVFVAWDTGLLSRMVVVKVIRRSLFHVAPDAEKLLLKEAAIVAKLQTPHVVRVFDAERYQRVLYIAMEYLPGVTLGNIQRQFPSRRVPPLLGAALLRQALLGLHAAHELRDERTGSSLGVVHRDVSPHNLMCTPQGETKVIDFGVARARDQLQHNAPSTTRLVGNPPYMAPEQISAPLTVDRRADIFSAGVVLWEICAGQTLFRRDNMAATLDAVKNFPVPPLSAVCPQAPPALAQAVHQALSRQREGRQGSAQEFADQLRQVLQEHQPGLLHVDTLAMVLQNAGVDLSCGGAPEDPLLDLRPTPLSSVPEVIEPGTTGTRDREGRDLEATPVKDTPRDPVAREPVPVPDVVANPAPHPVVVDGHPMVVDGQVLAVPFFEAAQELVTERGAPILVRCVSLSPQTKEPIELPLPLFAQYLERKWHVAVDLALRIVQLRIVGSARADRIEIYRGAPSAHNGQSVQNLPSTTKSEGERFYVGYRKSQVHEITVFAAESPEGGGPLRLCLPPSHGNLELVCEAPANRLVCLTTMASGIVHMAVVVVSAS